MHHHTTALMAMLTLSAMAAKDSRTFAVNHFYGKGPLVEGRMDPIVAPGKASSHVHTIQGGNQFGLTLTDTQLLSSTCTSSLIKNDKSAYWTPKLYFQDPATGTFTDVPLFYMNVYYFFEPTDDDIVAFQPGHRIVIGNTSLRTPPAAGGIGITDLHQGPPQPVQWTCPRSNYDIPSYPPNSDGMHGVGIQDPNNKGAGVGFPDMNCDGYASPLRADIHFPSCYNPAAGLDDFENNMQFPSSAGTTGGKENCPPGWIHTPHMFYEVYWNTPLFVDQWTQGQGNQPFVLSNGDSTGYSLHADFVSGWDVETLQQIIDNCDAGDSGMDKCPGLIGGVNDPSTSCNIVDAIQETITGNMAALPGDNPVTGPGAIISPPSPGSPAPSVSSSAPNVSPTTYGAPPGTIPSISTPSTTLATVPVATQAPPSSYPAPVLSSTKSTRKHSSKTTATPTTAQNTTSLSAPGVPVVTENPLTPYPSLSSSSAAPTSTSITPGWSYAGCFSDIRSSRVLSGITFANLGVGEVTTTGCIDYCGANGYTIAGTEYAGQCFCGDQLVGSGPLPESDCDMPCEGDASQICGGSLALSIWEMGGASSWKRHVHRGVHRRGAWSSG